MGWAPGAATFGKLGGHTAPTLGGGGAFCRLLFCWLCCSGLVGGGTPYGIRCPAGVGLPAIEALPNILAGFGAKLGGFCPLNGVAMALGTSAAATPLAANRLLASLNCGGPVWAEATPLPSFCVTVGGYCCWVWGCGKMLVPPFARVVFKLRFSRLLVKLARDWCVGWGEGRSPDARGGLFNAAAIGP